MNFSDIVAVFPLVFLAELPDKTMFASLVMASRGRPLAVWVGASVAFALHVAIAVSIGVALFHLLPHRAVEVVVAALFLAGAAYSVISAGGAEETAGDGAPGSPLAVAATATGVIFLAEWGDLTQVLTANLAAHYSSWLSVGVAAQAALMAVAALAVLSGSTLLARVPVRTLRLITAAVLTGLAAYTLASAF